MICYVLPVVVVTEGGKSYPTKCGETNAATRVWYRGKISSTKNWKVSKEFKDSCINYIVFSLARTVCRCLCVRYNITNTDDQQDCIFIPDVFLHWTCVIFISVGYLPVYFAFDINHSYWIICKGKHWSMAFFVTYYRYLFSDFGVICVASLRLR